MTALVPCPNPSCGRPTPVPEERLGRAVRCPHCRRLFIAAADTKAPGGETLGPGPEGPTEVPPKIGRFQVRGRLGAGAFATVYRAFDPQLDREVALKVPHPGSLTNPERAARFLREARAAAGLRHPHIVPVFQAGRAEGHYYLAAAYVPGRNLAEAAGKRSLGCRTAAQVVRELAEALAYAHEQGVVHRDVKPANVLLDEHGRAHLADFGLARRLEEAEKLTQEGALLGTPAYLAPEQATGGGAEAGPAGDQYSLGVVLYELLCGQTPFTGPPAAVLYSAQHAEPPRPRRLNPAVPRDLEIICLKALARKPEDRYPSCRELAEDLRRWLEGEPIRARRQGPAERLTRWARNEPVLAVLTLLVLGSLLAAAVVQTTGAARLAELAQSEAEARRQAEEDRRAEVAARAKAEANRREEQKARQDLQEQEKVMRQALEQARAAHSQEARAREDSRREQQKIAAAQQQAEETDRAARAARRREEEHRKKLRAVEARLEQLRGYRPLPLPEDRVVFDPAGRIYLVVGPAPDVPALRGQVGSVGWAPGTLLRWEKSTGEIYQEILCRKGKCWVNFRGNRLSPGSSITFRDAATGKETRSIALETSHLLSAAFNPEGTRLATVESGTYLREEKKWTGAKIRLWDTSTGKPLLRFATPTFDYKGKTYESAELHNVTFSPDGKRLITDDTLIRVWDTDTGRLLGSLGEGRYYSPDMPFPVFSPDGKHLVVDLYERMKVLAFPSGKELKLQGGAVWTKRPAFSADGRLLAAYGDYRIKVWDTGTGRLVYQFPPLLPPVEKKYTGAIERLAFCPDGKHLLSGGWGGVLLWTMPSGKGNKGR